MGRETFYRQRTRSEARSIQAKSFIEYLTSQIQKRREVSRVEAKIIATDCMDYLEDTLGFKSLGQIEFPAIRDNEKAHYRKARTLQDEKLIKLTVISDDDCELLEEFGTRVMVTARIARVIEEAQAQGALLDTNRLCVLFPLTATAVHHRIKELIDQGAELPLAGMTRARREKFKAPRKVLAVERYLAGEKLVLIRKSLCISTTQWRRWWNEFTTTRALKNSTTAEIKEIISEEEPVISRWQELSQKLESTKKARKLLLGIKCPALETTKSRVGFLKLLENRHGYSPAMGEDLLMFLTELEKEYAPGAYHPGQVTYIAVASTERPGTLLKEAELKAVNLDYLLSDDWEIASRDRTRELKWQRIERFAAQAYSQGAALTLPDIAFLVSASVDAVQKSIKEHPQVVLPTRGRVADMGSTLSHAEKIIELFMYGYTETEIKRRTGHSYDSIERYLLDFSKVVYLTERGLPAPAVRQTTGFSRRLTEKYLELYDSYKSDDYMFAMSKIRRFALRHHKKPKRKDDGKDDDG